MSSPEIARSQVGYGPFETPALAFEIGQLRSKVWKAPYTNGLTDIWRRRCNEYWKRVEQRFGVIMSEPRHAWADDPIVGPVVATYATPLAILFGERIPIGRVTPSTGTVQ